MGGGGLPHGLEKIRGPALPTVSVNDVVVKYICLESRLQRRLDEVTGELDNYVSMYQEAVVDVDRLKAALTEEITEHKHIRGVAEEQKQKADMALEELHRLGDPAQRLPWSHSIFPPFFIQYIHFDH